MLDANRCQVLCQSPLVFGHFGNPWAWACFVFIVTLFTFRQIDDDKHCVEKWEEYKARVEYRIFPGVY